MPDMLLTLNSIDERIGSLRRRKGELFEANERRFEQLNDLQLEENSLGALDSPTEDQVARLSEVQSLIDSLVTAIRQEASAINILDSEINQLMQRRDLMAEHHRQATTRQNTSRFTSHDSLGGMNAAFASRIDCVPASKEQQLEDISEWIRAKAISKRDNVSIVDILSGGYGQQFRNDRLAAAVTESGNSSLFPQNYRATLIEFLRAPVVIRNLPGITSVELVNGSYSQTRQTGTATGSYLGEQVYAAPSDPTTGALTMTAKKCFFLTVATGEALRRSSPQANAMIRNDLRESLARTEDLEFIRGTKTSTAPGGLKWFADQDAANQRITANGTVTIANIQSDLGKLLLLLANSNVPMTGLSWIMSNRTHLYLKNLRTSQEVYAFPELQDGLLLGIPVAATSAIPNNLGAGTNASEVYLVKNSEIMIGDSDYVGLEMSDVAAYHDGTNVRAAFSEDSVVFRLITESDIEMRHRRSVVYAQTVLWGS